jgi:hypothetical protein
VPAFFQKIDRYAALVILCCPVRASQACDDVPPHLGLGNTANQQKQSEYDRVFFSKNTL